jgi:hypothetical protein
MVKNLAQILNVNMNKNIFSNFFFVFRLILIILIFTKVSYSNDEKWDPKKFDENVKWNCISGNCIDGIGVATYSDPHNRSIKYSGNWKDQKRHGKGEQERNHYREFGVIGFNQKAYGEWKNDKVSETGYNKLIYSNGLIRHENWSDNKLIGLKIETPELQYVGEPIDLKFGVGEKKRYFAYLLKNCEAQLFKGWQNSYPVTSREKIDIIWYILTYSDNNHKIKYHIGWTDSSKDGDIYFQGMFSKDSPSIIKTEFNISGVQYIIRLKEKKAIIKNDDDSFLEYYCK